MRKYKTWRRDRKDARFVKKAKKKFKMIHDPKLGYALCRRGHLGNKKIWEFFDIYSFVNHDNVYWWSGEQAIKYEEHIWDDPETVVYFYNQLVSPPQRNWADPDADLEEVDEETIKWASAQLKLESAKTSSK